MSETIGQININLRMALTDFKKDVSDGTAAASKGIKEMGESFKKDTGEAKATLALLGEEIGVSIPRHIRGLIASFPGVGAALSAAFSSVAVIALIGVIVEIVNKIIEFRQKAAEAAEAIKKLGEDGQEAIHKIDVEVLSLQAQLDDLQGKYLKAAAEKLKLIDEQKFDNVKGEFDKIGADFNKVLDKMKVGWFETLLGMGGDDAIAGIKNQFNTIQAKVKELGAEGKGDEALNEIDNALMRVNEQLQHSGSLNATVVSALKAELDVLANMRAEYGTLNEKAQIQKNIQDQTFGKDQAARAKKALDDQIKGMDDLAKSAHELMEATRTLLGTDETERDKVIHKIDEEITAWKALDTQVKQNVPSVKTYYGAEITALEARKAQLLAETASLEQGFVPGAQKNKPLFIPSVTPTFTGTSDQLNLGKIQTDQKAAQDALTKVLDMVETENEKFKNQLVILEELHKQYPEVFDDKLLKRAADAINPVTQAWTTLGTHISDTIKTGALWGSSWKQELQSIGVEILQLVLKMTLLKNLQGGIPGGFSFSGLVNGLFGGGH